MFENRKALQAGANGILLSLLLYGLLLGAYLLASHLNLYPLDNDLALWVSFALAAISLAWSFSRGKPSIAYGGLHVFFALCCFGMAVLTQSVPVLFLPLVTSLLLFLFVQPIMALLSGRSAAVPLKWAQEEPLSYANGYRPSPSEVVYQEDRQPSSSSDPTHEQAQTLYPQSYE